VVHKFPLGSRAAGLPSYYTRRSRHSIDAVVYHRSVKTDATNYRYKLQHNGTPLKIGQRSFMHYHNMIQWCCTAAVVCGCPNRDMGLSVAHRLTTTFLSSEVTRLDEARTACRRSAVESLSSCADNRQTSS